MDVTALLLLDLQRDFLDAEGRLPVGARSADLVIASANRLLRHAEITGWKQIFIRSEFRKEDWMGNFFRRGSAIKGSAGAELDPRVLFSAAATILPKSSSDAFSNPKLDEVLRRLAVRHIVILGLMAEGCVRATVKSAIDKGYAITAVSDGIASSREFLRRFGLKRMQSAGAILMNTEAIPQAPPQPNCNPAAASL